MTASANSYRKLPSQADDEAERETYAHLHHVNLIAAAFLLVLALALSWTMLAFEHQQELERCFAAGRHDCVDIPAPPHVGILPPLRAPN